MAGIILDQFFNFNKTQGLKLILALSGDILLGVYVFEFFPKIFSKADDLSVHPLIEFDSNKKRPQHYC